MTTRERLQCSVRVTGSVRSAEYGAERQRTGWFVELAWRTYLDFIVERARLGGQQRAHLHAAGGGAPLVALAAAAAAGHVGAAALCGHTRGSLPVTAGHCRPLWRALHRARPPEIHRCAMRTGYI